MPGRAVTVRATFAPLPDDTQKPCDGGGDCPSRGFTDLGGVGTWYHEAVDYVLRNDLMGGCGSGLFGPDNHLSRAQLAQILYNKEGRPAVTGSSTFTDVAPGAWYAPAVTWATERGIAGGYGNGTFGPNDNITREQLTVMLWRYAGSPAATNKELHFNDADGISGRDQQLCLGCCLLGRRERRPQRHGRRYLSPTGPYDTGAGSTDAQKFYMQLNFSFPI